MPTVAGSIEIPKIAAGCGYEKVYTASTLEEIRYAVAMARVNTELALIEIKVALGARADLGRPMTTAEENKKSFMQFVQE